MFHATFIEENNRFQAKLVHEQVDEITAEGTRQKGIVEVAGAGQVLAVNNVGAVQVHSVENAGAEQVAAVTAEGNAQKSAITTYCEGQQTAIDLKVSAANTAKDDAVTAKEQAETAQRNSETAANTATQKASEAAEHDILTQTELTDEQKNTARTNINAAPVAGSYELIETITLTENVASIVRTQEPDGTPYAFSAVYITMKAIAPLEAYQPRLWVMYNNTYLNGQTSTPGNIGTEYDCYCTSITELINGMWQNKSVAPQKGYTWTGVLNSSVGYNPILEVDAPICNRVVIQKSSSLAWEIGCVFKIYGVRA